MSYGINAFDNLSQPIPGLIDYASQFRTHVPYTFPFFHIAPARRCGKTAAMRAMLDHPYFTNLTANHKEPTMRLSKAQKTANNIAAINAHAEQVKRMNDALQAKNAELVAAVAKLNREAEIRGVELSNRNQHIESFKLEALQLTTENATLRGYVGRVLEDDTVREVGGAKQPEAVLCDEDRSHLQQALHADNHSRRQAPRSVRSGPLPQVFYGMDMAKDNDLSAYLDRTLGRSGSVGNRNSNSVRHWLNR